MANSFPDWEFDYASAQVALLSERMARKLQAYVRRSVHAASQEIVESTMASLEGLERRLRLRIHTNTIHYNDQVEQLKVHLHDVRDEIWKLIEKQETKQEFHLTQILKDIRELSNCFRQAFTEGICVRGSSKSNFDEGVSDSGRKTQNDRKVLKPAVEQTVAIAVSNKVDDIQRENHGAAAHVHVKSSLLSVQPAPLGAYASYNSIKKTFQNTSMTNEAALIEGAEVIAENAEDSCNKLHEHLADDEDIMHALNLEEQTFRLSCKAVQNDVTAHVKEPLEPHMRRIEDENRFSERDTTILSNTHAAKSSKTWQQGQPDSKKRGLTAFSLTEGHVDSQGTDCVQEIEDGGFITVKRRNEYKFTMPSKPWHFLKENSAFPAKQQKLGATKLQRSGYKRPKCQFNSVDIERLVTAVEKFGIGRWRDVKETYFSVDRYLSAANLKDKWRSLLHSAKLTASKQRSMKLSSVLAKRVLELDEHEKLPYTRRPIANQFPLGW
ncbi:hypothetical protein GOP47_0009599 [Adiantum capillus-veneris]|uniref:Uncharacterized protein n=1 Tax=Adiantum capillus-veneris TaxID=13818 RepID=A0A9D4UWV3_ADICA|nr:hypothetical protein GOP47_0009599 [Adiantum capillus-veneris]